jgi:hypothetical protein
LARFQAGPSLSTTLLPEHEGRVIRVILVHGDFIPVEYPREVVDESV